MERKLEGIEERTGGNNLSNVSSEHIHSLQKQREEVNWTVVREAKGTSH